VRGCLTLGEPFAKGGALTERLTDLGVIHKGTDRQGRKLGCDFEQPLSVSSCAGELLCQRALRRRFNPPDAPTSLLTALPYSPHSHFPPWIMRVRRLHLHWEQELLV